MPSRWWVPLAGIRPEFVKLEFVHAAVSAWFDLSPVEHGARDKPYAISPPAGDGRTVGLEVAVLTEAMESRLLEQAQPGRQIRLGNQFGSVGRLRRVSSQSWRALAGCVNERSWELQFVTPTTFRRRDESSPLPTPASVLRGLSLSWSLWSDVEPRALAREDADRVWVSELDVRSQDMTVSGLSVSAVLGRVRYSCRDARIAEQVGPLFHLAPYAGVGALRGKGLGVTRLVTRRPGGRGGAEETTRAHGATR